MDISFQVKHSKNLETLSKKNVIVSVALFRVETIEKKISSLWDFIGTFKEYLAIIHKDISYQDLLNIKSLNPVLEISFNYTSLKEKKESHYSMETLLFKAYFLNDKQIEEVATDVFIALSDKWLNFYNKDSLGANA